MFRSAVPRSLPDPAQRELVSGSAIYGLLISVLASRSFRQAGQVKANSLALCTVKQTHHGSQTPR